MAETMDTIKIAEGTWEQRLDHIVETMRQLSRHTDPEQMVNAYSGRMREFQAMDRLVSLTRRGVEPPKFIVARDTEWDAQPNPWKQREQLPVLEGGLLGELAYADEPRLINDLHVDPDDPGFEYLNGYGSLAAVPVYDGGEALNMPVLLRRQRGAFDPEQLPQMVWTTNLFGRATHSLVLTNQVRQAYEMVDHELKVIADLQRSLLPAELPKIPTMDIATHYQPAQRAGGDYYDFFELPDGKWGLLMADVSGHGAPAAVLMAITQTLVHANSCQVCGPSALLKCLNEQLVKRYTTYNGRFVTAFFGVYDPAKRQMDYASAGHPPPRLKRCSDGSMFSIESQRHLPLGIDGDEEYETATVDLQMGDQIIFYTDGVTEAFNRQFEMFGLDRLDHVLHDCRIDASGLITAVLEALDAFTDGNDPNDDRTIIVARITP